MASSARAEPARRAAGGCRGYWSVNGASVASSSAPLVEAIEADVGMRAVLLGGPSAVETAAAERIMRETTARRSIHSPTTCAALVWLLDSCALIVSPDTGPLHIARALDRPLVGLYGYTNPKRYGPYDRPW